jgi:hypothetical protein
VSQIRRLGIEQRVAQKLRKARIPYERDVAMEGVRVDFLIGAPDGRLFVVETKSFSRRISDNILEGRQAQLFKDTTGADDAFVVIDHHPSLLSEGIVSEDDLVETLLSRFEKGSTTRKRRVSAGLRQEPERMIFAAMPFSPEYEDVYFVAMAYAARKVRAVCERVDQDEYQGDVVEKIKALIKNSVVVIADLSEAKPNVLYEVGYAHALKRPTIHICSTPVEQLPFDVRNWNTIHYVKGQTHKLRSDLVRRLKAIL